MDYLERGLETGYLALSNQPYSNLGFQHWIFLMYGKYVHKEQPICFIMPDQLQLYLKTTQLKKTQSQSSIKP